MYQYSQWSSLTLTLPYLTQGGKAPIRLLRKLLIRRDKGDTLSLSALHYLPCLLYVLYIFWVDNVLNQHFLSSFFFPSAQVSPVFHKRLSITLVGDFLRFFASSPPSPILSLVSHPWALALRMTRRSRWSMGSCGCEYWLLVGIAPPLSL